jgi:prepilin peptidase CpaA
MVARSSDGDRILAALDWGRSMSVTFASVMLALLLVAAWRDIVTRTIPDTVSLLLFAVGGLARILNGPSALAFSAAAALLLFILLLIVHSHRLIGGGDVKIMTALAVGLSPLDCYHFVVATIFAGGLLGLTYLLLSRRLGALYTAKRISLLSRVFAVEAWRIRRRGPLPYGVAIAAGGAFVLLHSGSF